MLVKSYSCVRFSNDNTPIIWSLNPDIYANDYIKLRDIPILESVSYSMCGKKLFLHSLQNAEPLNNKEFDLFYPLEQKIIAIQDMFADIHQNIPYGKYIMDDVIVMGLSSNKKHKDNGIDVQDLLKAGLLTKAMVLLNQEKDLPSYVDRIIEEYMAKQLLEV